MALSNIYPRPEWKLASPEGPFSMPDIGMELVEKEDGVYVQDITLKGLAKYDIMWYCTKTRESGCGPVPVGGKVTRVERNALELLWQAPQDLGALFRALQQYKPRVSVDFYINDVKYQIILGFPREPLWQMVARQGSFGLPDIGMYLSEKEYGIFIENVIPGGRATNVPYLIGSSCRTGTGGSVPSRRKLTAVQSVDRSKHLRWGSYDNLTNLYRLLQQVGPGTQLEFCIEDFFYTVTTGEPTWYV